jgi:predicted DCC family thiol-disulfide oxidoreductase YuxK
VIKPLFAADSLTFRSPIGRRIFVPYRAAKGSAPVQRAPYAYKADPAVPAFVDDRPIIIFDGKCVLCSWFARFVLRTDRAGRFRLLAAQSQLGTALYHHFGLDPIGYETYVLLEDGKAFLRSEASLRIFAGLGAPWPALAAVGRIVPLSLRDGVYNFVARHRLQWFGSREACYLSEPSHADRFLG